MISYRNVFSVLGVVLFLFAGLMLVPALVDFCQLQKEGIYFITGSLFCCFIGGLLFFSCNYRESVYLNATEKVLSVFLSWIILPCVAAIPMIISPMQMSITDSIFDATAALTTTETNIISDLRNFSDGFLLWRGILQLFGGIGFIISCLHVFADFRLSEATDDNRQSNISLIRQLKTISIIYCSLILVASLGLTVSGVGAIHAFCDSLAAISTGGMIFSADTNTASSQLILAFLMFVGGISVTLLRNSLNVGLKALANQQFRYYITIIGIATAFLTVYIYRSIFFDLNVSQSFAKAFFTVTSSISTTCVPTDVHFSKFIDSLLYILNFCGGCSGSCSGGIKIFRFMIMFAIIKSYLLKLTRPNAVCIPTYLGKRIEYKDVSAILAFFVCYLVLAVICAIILTVDIDFGKAFGAAITTMSNSHTFFGLYKATATEIIALSSVSKYTLIFAMIAGRVEYVMFFMVLIKAFWKR